MSSSLAKEDRLCGRKCGLWSRQWTVRRNETLSSDEVSVNFIVCFILGLHPKEIFWPILRESSRVTSVIDNNAQEVWRKHKESGRQRKGIFPPINLTT